MTKDDEIAHALQHIAAHGGDLPLETDLALKALAAAYNEQREEISQAKEILDGYLVDANVTPEQAMRRLGKLFDQIV